jgi:hypothetical protein
MSNQRRDPAAMKPGNCAAAVNGEAGSERIAELKSVADGSIQRESALVEWRTWLKLFSDYPDSFC